MAQAVLSAASVIQAKTGSSANASTADVALDSGTTAGSTVTIELWAGNVPFTDGGLGGTVPDGFETDAMTEAGGTKLLYVFRKRDVAAGEGVAGSTPWTFTFIANNTWAWRVTEWNSDLEPVFPLEQRVGSFVDGAPATISTGTTPTTSRPNVVCLAAHLWWRAPANGTRATWSGHTNGFVERDAFSADMAGTTTAVSLSWSWLFATSTGTFECTASRSTGNASTDDEAALLVVYAATTYA